MPPTGRKPNGLAALAGLGWGRFFLMVEYLRARYCRRMGMNFWPVRALFCDAIITGADQLPEMVKLCWMTKRPPTEVAYGR
jgi:hypothetical protein